MSLIQAVIQLFRLRYAESTAAPPPLPAGRKAIVSRIADEVVESEAQASPTEATRGECIGCAFFIRYRDARGHASERRITVRALWENGEDITVHAFCWERQGPRCFLASRMAEVTDLGTGEVVEDAIGFFRSFGVSPKPAPRKKRVRADDDNAEILRDIGYQVAGLVYMARADGKLHAKETEHILDFIGRQALDLRYDRDRMAKHIARLYPDRGAFEEALQWIDDMGIDPGDDEYAAEDGIDLYDTLMAIVGADGVVTPEEASLVRAMRSQVTQPAK